MTTYKVEPLDDIQLPLVNRFYKSARFSAKAGRGEAVFVVRDSSTATIVAAVRLQPERNNDWWFLRSMCVAPDLRGQGIGQLLLDGLQDFLQDKACFCYPFVHLESFYRQGGFELIDIDDAEVQHSTPQFMQEPLERYRRQGRKIILMALDRRA